jgi:hypothetical protein
MPVFVCSGECSTQQIPVFRMMKVGEATVDQRADEVHRQRDFSGPIRRCGSGARFARR